MKKQAELMGFKKRRKHPQRGERYRKKFHSEQFCKKIE